MNKHNPVVEVLARIWHVNLILKIIVGLALGIGLAVVVPQWTWIGILGELFVGALKGVAPVLVFFMVMAALATTAAGVKTNMKRVIVLYLLGTVLAATVAVVANYIFRVPMVLPKVGEVPASNVEPAGSIGEVIHNLLLSMVDNPVNAIVNANYVGILTWAVILGVVLKHASEGTKKVVSDASAAINAVVQIVVQLAPFGILGLAFNATVGGFEALVQYAKILVILVGVMLFIALVANPFLVFLFIHRNPFPLVIKTLVRSGLNAFFTRSSAANIPVNMQLCRELGLDERTYSVSIPLGATINMGGAAITISTLALSTAWMLHIDVDLPSAILLCLISAIGATGASGVPGGSMMLVPLACSLFSIPSDIAFTVAGVGFIIGVVQDSCETALNSSTDVLYTATAELSWRRTHPDEYRVQVEEHRQAQARASVDAELAD